MTYVSAAHTCPASFDRRPRGRTAARRSRRRPAACTRAASSRRARRSPEAAQRDRRRAAELLGQQQRDQVAADDEEHLDAEEPAGEPRHVGVVQQHGDDGDRPQAVEAGQVAASRRRRRGRARWSPCIATMLRPWPSAERLPASSVRQVLSCSTASRKASTSSSSPPISQITRPSLVVVVPRAARRRRGSGRP